MEDTLDRSRGYHAIRFNRDLREGRPSALVRRRLLDILACPMDKYYPLRLLEFEAKEDLISEGVLICSKCGRYYPIIDEIPVMLPDELRSKDEDLQFLRRWGAKLPPEVVSSGKPYNLS